jgi:hypothetical protein
MWISKKKLRNLVNSEKRDLEAALTMAQEHIVLQRKVIEQQKTKPSSSVCQIDSLPVFEKDQQLKHLRILEIIPTFCEAPEEVDPILAITALFVGIWGLIILGKSESRETKYLYRVYDAAQSKERLVFQRDLIREVKKAGIDPFEKQV